MSAMTEHAVELEKFISKFKIKNSCHDSIFRDTFEMKAYHTFLFLKKKKKCLPWLM